MKSHLLLCVGLAAALPGTAQHNQPASSASRSGVATDIIIDLHCHTAGIGAGRSGCFVSDNLRRSFKFRHYLRSFGVTLEEVRSHGDALIIHRLSDRLRESARVSHAVVLAMDGVIGASGELDRAKTEIYVPNEFVAAETAKHDNLLFGASINPYRNDALERLRWAKANGAVLVKWLPSIMHIDPADARLVPFYRLMKELQLPLLTHTGAEHAFTRAEDAFCDPKRLELPLSEGVVVIAAHAATTGSFAGEPAVERLAKMMPCYANLYADISSLTQINKRRYIPLVARRPEFRGRLVYGTDYPLINLPILVSPVYHMRKLGWCATRQIRRVENVWDRDVRLKEALGFTPDIWIRGRKILDLPSS